MDPWFVYHLQHFIASVCSSVDHLFHVASFLYSLMLMYDLFFHYLDVIFFIFNIRIMMFDKELRNYVGGEVGVAQPLVSGTRLG